MARFKVRGSSLKVQGAAPQHVEPRTSHLAPRTSLLGAYIHVPFCSAICHYCNFNRGLLDPAVKARYVRALCAEIRRAGRPDVVDTIYLGGGTPSLLDPPEFEAILGACRDAFHVAPQAEITLEANPETVSRARLAAFKAAGITRVSFGVQSFRDEELQRLGRLHSAARARAAYEEARSAGFDNISLDLIMWLPQQTVGHWLESVEALVDMGPDHASLYLLELYPNAPLKEDMARRGWSLAPDEDAATMYMEALARLDAAGYEQYEISNVARPGYASRHNVKYWSDGEWLAFGCGAHGALHRAPFDSPASPPSADRQLRPWQAQHPARQHPARQHLEPQHPAPQHPVRQHPEPQPPEPHHEPRPRVRWSNVRSTLRYIEAIEAGRSVVAERSTLNAAEAAAEAIITALRLTAGVDADRVRERYGLDVRGRYAEGLRPFADLGYVRLDWPQVRLTRAGMLVANEIMQGFV